MSRPSFLAGARTAVPMLALALGAVMAALVPSATTSGAAEPGVVQRAARTAPPMFGGTVFEKPGETYREAYRRVIQQYGGSVDAVRMFFPGMPGSWDSITAKVDDTPLVVSFRTDVAGVLAGRYDAAFRQWFADAPTDRRTYWTYWHEPEDDSVDPLLYRQAWAHIRALADGADNRKLRATLVLMCWSLDPSSGRNWKDYYPGGDVVSTLAFDCYNTGRKNGVYRDPAKILAPVKNAAASLGKPWGIAEFGTTVVETDGGEQGRARWLRGMGNYVQANGGKFATYFDSYVGFDYRLHDQISRDAWKAVVQRASN